MSQPPYTSPPWGTRTRQLVLVAVAIFVVLLLWRFQYFVTLLTWAGLLTYILDPMVTRLDERTPLKRGMTVILLLLLLTVGLVVLFILVRQPLVDQYYNLEVLLPGYIDELVEQVDQPLPILGISLNLGDFITTAEEQIGAAISGFAEQTLQVALNVVITIGNAILVIIIAAYMLADVPAFHRAVESVVPTAYYPDFLRLRHELSVVWGQYFRGRIVLAISMGVLTGTTLAILGVRNALVLGVIAGFVDFVPLLGATVVSIPILLVAYFQDGSWIGLSGASFFLLVLVVFLIIQQIEAQILQPRILGQSVQLHPLVVLVGLMLGASVAGILGLLLAAPVIASARVIGVYIWTKVWDEPPRPKSPDRQIVVPNETDQPQHPPADETTE